MPELPEVQTVRETLKQFLIGKTIKDIKVFYERIIDNTNKDSFRSSLIGQEVKDIKRKGKYLIFEFNDYFLISHLRMEGKYFRFEDEDFDKHDHIVFFFDDFNLRYNDVRKFGRMYLFPKNIDIYNVYPLNCVGNDVFEGIDKDKFSKIVTSKKLPIKTVLLDQSIMSGLGNIYVDEVLFMSHLHPLTLACRLDNKDIENIITNSYTVLSKAISLGGTTIKSFASAHNISGRFQNELLVHTKEICINCKARIEKIRVGGRGTYICPHCQVIK